MRPKAIAVTTGVLAAILVGWPAVGALSSLFWSTGMLVDAPNDHQRVAQRILRESARRQHGGIPANWEGKVPSPDCGIGAALDVSTGAKRERLEDLLRLRISYDLKILESVFDGYRLDALLALPKPILGALSGCMGGSIGSIACHTYVKSYLDKTVGQQTHAIEQVLLRRTSRVNRSYCWIVHKTISS